MLAPLFPGSLRLGMVACLVLSLLGCGSESVGKVAGKVTLNDEPLTQGSVVFEDKAKGISVVAPLKADGTFEVKTHDSNGLPPGMYKVGVSPGSVGTGETPLAIDPTTISAPVAPTVPAKYQNPDTSDLTAQVEAGNNEPYHFVLEK